MRMGPGPEAEPELDPGDCCSGSGSGSGIVPPWPPGWESELGRVFQPPSGLSCYHRDHQGPADLAQGLITNPGPQGSLSGFSPQPHEVMGWTGTSSDWERERARAWGDQDLSLWLWLVGISSPSSPSSPSSLSSSCSCTPAHTHRLSPLLSL